MLEISRLSKTFQVGAVSRKVALDSIDLSVKSGEFITIIGSNGAGKSTLLNVISGVYPADSGAIRIDGVDVTRQPEHKRASMIGRVFQNPMIGTAKSMTIEENLSMACSRGMRRGLRRGVKAKDRQKYAEYLKLLDLGLENRLSTPVGLLSGGQRQALTLLMATISKPKLLLLDEHTAALDPKTAAQIVELTELIVNKYKLTVLMVTHNLEQALSLGNRTIMMHEGSVILDVRDPERKRMTVSDLLDRFARLRGQQLVDDRILLA